MKTQFSFSRLSRPVFVVSLVTVLVLFAAYIVSARTWLKNDGSRKPLAQPRTSTGSKIIQPEAGQAQSQSPTAAQPEQLEVELITVGPNGFEPALIKRPAGPFLLVIQNRSGTDLGPLLLEADESGRPTPGNRIASARIDRERLDYSELLELPSGNYRLRQSENSAWSFRISLTPR
jgi:hypothetical protein